MALADDGTTEERNLQLLCGYCNRVKGTKGKDGYRLKVGELRADNVATGVRADNVATGVMVDEGLAVFTGKRLGPSTTVGRCRRNRLAAGGPRRRQVFYRCP